MSPGAGLSSRAIGEDARPPESIASAWRAMPAYVLNRDDVTWRVVDDEAVVVHAKTSEYYSLNQSGTWLWCALETPRTHDELAAGLAARYQRPATDIAGDVEAFLAALERAGLLLRAAAAAMATSPSSTPPLDPYEPPQLVKFGDLETLILSGE